MQMGSKLSFAPTLLVLLGEYDAEVRDEAREASDEERERRYLELEEASVLEDDEYQEYRDLEEDMEYERLEETRLAVYAERRVANLRALAEVLEAKPDSEFFIDANSPGFVFVGGVEAREAFAAGGSDPFQVSLTVATELLLVGEDGLPWHFRP